MKRTLEKAHAGAPHEVLLVVDATNGQNAIAQARQFHEALTVSGFVLTKLDGTAKGGIVVAIADRFGLPVHAIGVGEGIDDFKSFAAEDFARNLVAA
jgi:fused signal recognition particle receptor